MSETNNYPNLLRPIALGPVTLRNRAMVSAHGMGLADGGDGVSERYHQYLTERARGGAALVAMESAPVAPGIADEALSRDVHAITWLASLGVIFRWSPVLRPLPCTAPSGASRIWWPSVNTASVRPRLRGTAPLTVAR